MRISSFQGKCVLAAVLLMAGSVWGIKVTIFENTELFVSRAEDIVIADVVDVPDPPKNVNYGDGLYMVNVNIVSVVKGIIPLGRAKIWTIYPVEKEKRYAFTTQRGQIAGTDVMAAIPQLSVVQVDMDLKNLQGKTTTEQMTIIFQKRLDQIQAQQARLEEEQKLLEHAIKNH